MGIKELYRSNADFKSYVDRFCRTGRYTVNQVLDHSLVKAVADQYANPDDTYSFGNVGPLSRLTNADRIRAMSDEELADDRIDRIDMYCHSDSEMWIGDFEGVCDTREQAVAEELNWLKQEV